MAVKLNIEERSIDDTPTWTITLERVNNGVNINASHEGLTWNLLKIKNDGTFIRLRYLDGAKGFQLDGDERLKESDED